MAITYILRSTNSDLSGGTDFTKALTSGAATGEATQSVGVANNSTESSFGFTPTGEPGANGTSTGSFTVEVRIGSTGSSVITVRPLLVRTDASGNNLSSEIFPAEAAQTCTANSTFTFTWTDPALGTWSAGDRLKVIYQFVSSQTMGGAASVTVSFNTANSEVVTPFTTGTTVAIPVSTATAAAPAPSVVFAATVAVPVATATAAAPAPTVSTGGGGGGSAPTVAGTPTNGSDASATNNFNVTLPTGRQTTEWGLVGIGSSGGTIDTPSGWTAGLSNSDISNPHVFWFYRKFDGGESDTLAMTKGGGTQNIGWVAMRIADADATTFLDVTAVKFSGGLGTETSLDMNITTSTDHALVIGFVSLNSGSTAITPPGTMTEVAESTAGRIIEAAVLDKTPAGDTGTLSWTWTSGRATAGVILAVKPAAGGGTNVAVPVATATAMAPAPIDPTGYWRWYTDATPDGSMTALAERNTTPTLTGAQTMGDILRLRVSLIASVTALHMEYSVDGTNWRGIPNADNTGVSNAQNPWFTWANGAATAGNTIGTRLLPNAIDSGIYVESRGQALTVSGSNRTEFDLAFKVRWPPPNTTILIRLLDSTTPITIPVAISLTTCAVADRSHTIDKADAASDGGQNREVNHSAWPRMFHDGTYWWTFVTQPATDATDLVCYRWSGSGTWVKSTYNSAATITTLVETDIKHAPWMRTISSTPVVGVGLFPASGNMRYLRGYVSSGAITWNAEVDVGVARYGSQSHACIDQGGFHWIAGIDSTAGVWARRSSAADDGGTTYSPSFNAKLTLADSGVAAGDIAALVPLASNSVLLIWRNGSDLRAAEVTSAGFGTAQTVNSTAAVNAHDWGATLAADGLVYVVHTDSTGTGGTWKTRTYNPSTDTWAAGTDPGITGQNSNADGLVVTAIAGGGIAVFGTDVGTDGGQDRTIQSKTWNGSVWSSKVVITPAGGRGNGDDIAGPYVSASNQIPILYLFNDCDIDGVPYTYEYHVLSLSNDVTVVITLSTASAAALAQAIPMTLSNPLATATGASPPTGLVVSIPLSAASATASAPVPALAASPIPIPLSTTAAVSNAPIVVLSAATPTGTATANAPPPALPRTLDNPLATASAAAPAPIFGGSNIALPTASATADASAPTVHVTLAIPVATASALAPAPTVSTGGANTTVALTLATGTAAAATPSIPATLASPVATATADTLAPVAVVTSVLSTTTATADAATPSLPRTLVVPVATATATAPAPSVESPGNVPIPLSTATAQALAPSIPATLANPLATTSAAAQAPTATVVAPVPAATATGEAHNPSIPLTLTVPVATAAAMAPAPTVILPGSLLIPTSVATAQAHTPAVIYSNTLAIPTASATAAASTPSLPRVLDVPTATASASAAQPALPRTLANPTAPATATASAPAVTVHVPVSTASATAAAQPPVLGVDRNVAVSTATATAQAHAPFFTTGPISGTFRYGVYNPSGEFDPEQPVLTGTFRWVRLLTSSFRYDQPV